ncbi:MAG: hypothetical protein JKY34_07900, partial [Kordiimonadaceae bacterium]|nr:hypothetical protein [Kordiimonadaceae bacterium]
MTDAQRIEREAADWIAKFDSGQVGSHQIEAGGNAVEAFCRADQAFTDWVSASFINRTAFLRAHQAWCRADRLAALPQAAGVTQDIPQDISQDISQGTSTQGTTPQATAFGLVHMHKALKQHGLKPAWVISAAAACLAVVASVAL